VGYLEAKPPCFPRGSLVRYRICDTKRLKGAPRKLIQWIKLYVATTAEPARIEAESRITAPGVVRAPSKPYVHFTVRGRLQKVLDLTDARVLETLKTTADEMTAP